MSRFSTSLYKRDDEKSMNEALQAKPDYFSSWVRFLNLRGLITSFVASTLLKYFGHCSPKALHFASYRFYSWFLADLKFCPIWQRWFWDLLCIRILNLFPLRCLLFSERNVSKRNHTKRLLAKVYYSPQSKVSISLRLVQNACRNWAIAQGVTPRGPKYV